MFGIPLFPDRASTIAAEVDALYFFLVGLSVVMSMLIATLVVAFAIRFHRRHADQVGAQVHGGLMLELAWTIVPFLITMVIFFWGAKVYFVMASPPQETLNIYVIGKQWMWKVQHTNGQREINQLHVPVGRPVKLIMTSEDVIHNFSIPAMRVKADVIPGRFVQMWFEPTRPGSYQIFCAEYCGTQHSGMIGQVVVMEPNAYQTWLSGGAPEGPLAATGEKLFGDLACDTCHRPNSSGHGPMLQNVFGRSVKLDDGTMVTADENYLRESILTPGAKIVAGYQPVMPAFQGLVSEEQLLALIEYIKSLSTQQPQQNANP
jgi:cytochrome c oxidase subunit II